MSEDDGAKFECHEHANSEPEEELETALRSSEKACVGVMTEKTAHVHQPTRKKNKFRDPHRVHNTVPHN